MNEPNNNGPNIDSAFLTLLQQHRGGHALTDCSVAMRQAITGAQATGKASGLVLKIAFKPTANGVQIVTDVKPVLPKEQAPASFFYCDEVGNLHRNDPNQRELPLRSIEGGAVEVATLKSVSAV